MSDNNNQGVVDLVDAGVPADQGLSSLGLLMQLAGNMLAAYGALITFVLIFMPNGGNGETLWMFLLLGLSITRSMLQRSAGAQLLYGSNTGLDADPSKNQRMAGMRRYVWFGLGQSAFFGLALAMKFHVPTKITIGVTAGLALWPAVLAVLMQLPRFKRFRDDLPLPEDKGFEGAAILMTVLGLVGLVATGSILLVLLDAGGRELNKGPGVLIMLSLIMLCIRSVLHVQAGFAGLRETSVDRSVELANRYANFGVISSFCGGGAMILFVMSMGMNIAGMALVCGLCWMLMAWPLIIRRFFSDRQFADLLAGEQAPVHRRAPDAGLTSLGWLLLAYAVFTAAFLLPEIMMGADRDMRGLQQMLAIGGSVGLRSMWWSIGLVVLQAWAGYELIRMSPQSRIIATLYGAVGVALAFYLNWPVIQMFKHMRGAFDKTPMLVGPLALALIIPVATILLVNRKIAPTARARFRSQQPPQPSPSPSA